MKRLDAVRSAVGGCWLIAAGAAAGWFSLDDPYRGFQGETFVRFERGTGTVDMGRDARRRPA